MNFKLFATTVLALASVACDIPDCGSNSDNANFLRSLPVERYERLYSYSVSLGSENKTHRHFDLEKNPLPKQLSDLPIKVIKVNKRHVLYRLEGCLDHHLDLVLKKTGENSPRIELRSEEHPRIVEVLWEK
ncbi:hypothetical protein NBRC116583_39070 [Arenicella sp. 4NH20-0111]|uniref:hypothetical protein n=1 Tax=Arenicella sp. 4NH20-0111 TaxID=3127648 RepID=UPI0031042BC2